MTDTNDVTALVGRMFGAVGTSRIVERRYGENPHQKGWTVQAGEPRPGVLTARQVQGKELSYNNINDTDAAYECVAEFDPDRTAACAIIKHANPCGVAKGATLAEAYKKAYRCDMVSAFGGIVALNQCLDEETAHAITKIFTEVIIAPDATPGAVAAVAQKKDLRLLLAGGLPKPWAAGLVVKSIAGGLLVQQRDNTTIDSTTLKTLTREAPLQIELDQLLFANQVAKHVKSNAMVFVKDMATVGIGAGQMSRLDSVRIAVRKAADLAKALGLAHSPIKGSFLASDAFIPFADGLLEAIEAGVAAVIQPGGSVRDAEVIKAADDHHIAMVFTGMRHFRH